MRAPPRRRRVQLRASPSPDARSPRQRRQLASAEARSSRRALPSYQSRISIASALRPSSTRASIRSTAKRVAPGSATASLRTKGVRSCRRALQACGGRRLSPRWAEPQLGLNKGLEREVVPGEEGLCRLVGRLLPGWHDRGAASKFREGARRRPSRKRSHGRAFSSPRSSCMSHQVEASTARPRSCEIGPSFQLLAQERRVVGRGRARSTAESLECRSPVGRRSRRRVGPATPRPKAEL